MVMRLLTMARVVMIVLITMSVLLIIFDMRMGMLVSVLVSMVVFVLMSVPSALVVVGMRMNMFVLMCM
jgi:hypothetical protein